MVTTPKRVPGSMAITSDELNVYQFPTKANNSFADGVGSFLLTANKSYRQTGGPTATEVYARGLMAKRVR